MQGADAVVPGRTASAVGRGFNTSTPRVLIAPDSYGESLTAAQAAAAIATGWHRSRPRDQLVIAPQSDGGPGFITVLAQLGEVRTIRVCGPLGDGDRDDDDDDDDEEDEGPEAEWIFDAGTATAYIESAQACGLARLDETPSPQTALRAHTRGVGDLVDAALRAGARRIIIGLGGSASTDGGRGMIARLGGLEAARRLLADVEIVAACDVRYPLLGPWGAARVFSPQKGADPATVAELEQRLERWSRQLDEAAGWAVSGATGAGAAGGLGAALLALGAVAESGAEIVAASTGLKEQLAAADLLVTGEGHLDQQSLHGKVVGSLAAAARERQLPVLVLAGQISLDEQALKTAGIAAARAIADHAGSVRFAQVDAANQLIGLATVTAAQIQG